MTRKADGTRRRWCKPSRPHTGRALMGNKHDHKPGTNSQRAPIANNGRQPAGVLA